MPRQILEPVERSIATGLLRFSDIYDLYQETAGVWVALLQDMKKTTSKLADEQGRAVTYTPYQLVRDSLGLLTIFSEDVLERIRRLKLSETFESKDLYERLDRLEIRRVSEPDRKGLFLLAATAAEASEVFDE